MTIAAAAWAAAPTCPAGATALEARCLLLTSRSLLPQQLPQGLRRLGKLLRKPLLGRHIGIIPILCTGKPLEVIILTLLPATDDMTRTYRYYYWSTIFTAAAASVVTYSTVTETTTVTVYASDGAEATASLAEITETLFTTPAAATSLESLVGVTSGIPFTSPTRSQPTVTGIGSGTGTPRASSDGPSMRGGLDWLGVCFTLAGLGIGFMAVWL